ncbi:MAG: M3 family metallopeptidase [Candidatus Baltobacteraceae bacterium]
MFNRSLRNAALALAAVLFVPTLALAAAPKVTAGAPTQLDFSLTATQIKANCAQEIAAAKGRIDRMLMLRSARTFETVVVPLESITADLSDNLAVETFLNIVAPERAVRDASLACSSDVSGFYTELGARKDLYEALAAAKASNTAHTPDEQKLLQLWYVSQVRSGSGLPDDKRRSFVALSQKLTDLQNAYQANLSNDTTAIRISTKEAAGLSADFVATLKRDADASYIVPVDESTISPFVENATNEAARKRFYFAYANRAAAKNVTLLQQAIAVRDQLAHLMGYPTWAAYVLDDRMAKSPERVRTFLDKLDAALLPKARQEIARLAALKAKHEGVPNARLQPWDVGYYDNLLRTTAYAVDTNEVRQYFPVQHVIDGVLGIYQKVLGVKFAAIPNATVWYPDVQEYAVSDSASGRFIGTFYLDLFPRDGKYKHFENAPILAVRRLDDGSYRAPVSTIIGNWPKPAPGHPALLSHDDVVTFFHEFGHNMAALLATAPYETLSSGFRQDFIEAPSQMLENWVWDPAILHEISSNVKTGEPLPAPLIAKMIAAKHVDEAYDNTRQVALATIDLDYHTMGAHVDTTAVWARDDARCSPMAMPAGVRPEGAFEHLMGGYDAGYYGYLWSKVYAQDMFTRFQSGGLESPIVGAAYRKDILEPARAIEPDEMVATFLGRPMNPDAFYRDMGITP